MARHSNGTGFGDGVIFTVKWHERTASVRRLETAAPWPPAVYIGFGDGVIFTVKWQSVPLLFGGWKPPLLGLRRFELRIWGRSHFYREVARAYRFCSAVGNRRSLASGGLQI